MNLQSSVKKQKLIRKLIILVLFPSVALLMLAGQSILQKWRDYQSLEATLSEIDFLAGSLDMMHSLQKERTLSSSAEKSIDSDEAIALRVQREQVDAGRAALMRFDLADQRYTKLKQDMQRDFLQLDTARQILNATNDADAASELITSLIFHCQQWIRHVEVKNQNFLDHDKVDMLNELVDLQEMLAHERAVILLSIGNNTGLSVNLKLLIKDFQSQSDMFKQLLADQNFANEHQDVIDVLMKPEWADIKQQRELLLSKTSKDQHLLRLQRVLGYGGLISHYKDFMMTGAENHRRLFFKYYQQTLSVMDDLWASRLSDQDQDDLLVIESVLDEYYQNILKLPAARQGVKNSQWLEFESRKINDFPAMNALEKLSQRWSGIDVALWAHSSELIDADLVRLLNQAVKSIRDDVASMRDRSMRIGMIQTALTVFSLLVCYLLSAMVIRWLENDVKSVVDVLRTVRDTGDLRKRISLTGQDEVAEIAGAINTLLEGRAQGEEELNKAKQAAEIASRQKGEFLANMSHEIRTPMNAIIGFSDLASRNNKDPKVAQYLTQVNTASRSLLGIVNDILDFSKMEAGKLKIESLSFSLSDEIEKIATLFSVSAYAKKIELCIDVAADVPEWVTGDPLRVSQILINLINNAIKFTEQGEVVLSVRVKQVLPNQIQLSFSVSDTGIGISQQQLAHLFEPFSQADGSTTRRFGGTGLGLSIVKSLAELMGGSIEASSAIGRGSVFNVNLLFNRVESNAPSRSKAAVELADKRFMLLESNDVSRKILGRVFTQLGFECIECKDVYDLARHQWNAQDYVGVFCIHSDQIEHINKFVKQYLNPEIPIIAILQSSQDELSRQCAEQMSAVIMEKPVSKFRLQTVLEKMVSNEVSVDLESARQIPQFDATVLLVDDNDINQMLGRELLEQAGLNVVSALDGLQALNLIKQQSFGLVLMDIQMPVMDGYTAMREIRKLESARFLPIIAVTASVMAGDQAKCINAGANDYLPKPIQTDLLYEKLMHWLPVTTRRAVEVPGGVENATPELIPVQSIIAVDNALLKLGGRIQLYGKLLDAFLEHNRNHSQELKTQLNAQHWDEALRLVHSMKGTAGNIGADSLAQRAAEIEQLLKSEASVPDDVMQNYESHFSSVMIEVERLACEYAAKRKLA